MNELSEYKIQNILKSHFGIRQNIIVPNVSWGWTYSNRELDLVLVRKSKWCDEIEIKISKSDIKADLKKHGKGDYRIRYKYFAVPSALKDDTNIPEDCGILEITDGDNLRRRVIEYRKPTKRNTARKLKDDEISKLLHLSNMRFWNARDAIEELKFNNKYLRELNDTLIDNIIIPEFKILEKEYNNCRAIDIRLALRERMNKIKKIDEVEWKLLEE